MEHAAGDDPQCPVAWSTIQIIRAFSYFSHLANLAEANTATPRCGFPVAAADARISATISGR
jgi:hypothetical protein